MPGESINGNPPASEATNAPVEPSEDKPVGVEISGKVYTAEDVQRLIDAEKNFQRGFTKKTEEIARLKDGVEAERGELAQMKKTLTEQLAALRKDVEFYSTHDKEDWAGYQSSWAQISGSPPGVDPTLQQLISKMDELSSKVDRIYTSGVSKTVEDEIDATMRVIDEVLEEFPLSTIDGVVNTVNLHRRVHGVFPGREDIRAMAKAQHDALAIKGVKIEKPTVTSVTPQKVTVAPPPALQKPAMPDARNARAVEKAWEEFIAQRSG